MTEEEKKQHGGKRKGAGRKPGTIKIGRFTIKAGQRVLTILKVPEGVVGGLRPATVSLSGASRSRTITLDFGDGETMDIIMMS